MRPVSAEALKRSEGGSQRLAYEPVKHTTINASGGIPPMKWHVKSLYVKAVYVTFVLASLVAAAAAGYKWH